MANLRQTIGADARQRWIEVLVDEKGAWRWRRVNVDHQVEAESKGSFKDRFSAETAAAEAKGNEAFDVHVGPSPSRWEQQSEEETGRRGGRSVPRGRD
ncbi:MAG: hypothetical protein ACRDHM_07400 [Actinomycetota bacterium]